VNLPLGPSYAVAFVSAPEAAAHPASRRRYLYNLVASESTGNTTNQKRGARGSNTRRTWREAALAWRLQLADDQTALPFGVPRCAYVAVTMEWVTPADYLGGGAEESSSEASSSLDCPHAGALSRTGVTDAHVPQRDWRKVLLDSVFTLSPSGHNIECFRFWEAAEAGSIPVLVANEGSLRGGLNVTESGCGLHPEIMEHAPFIFATDLHEAWRTMLALAADPSALDRRALQVREWYSKYLHTSMEKVEDLFLRASLGSLSLPKKKHGKKHLRSSE
jgi:hypothetical protein